MPRIKPRWFELVISIGVLVATIMATIATFHMDHMTTARWAIASGLAASTVLMAIWMVLHSLFPRLRREPLIPLGRGNPRICGLYEPPFGP